MPADECLTRADPQTAEKLKQASHESTTFVLRRKSTAREGLEATLIVCSVAFAEHCVERIDNCN